MEPEKRKGRLKLQQKLETMYIKLRTFIGCIFHQVQEFNTKKCVQKHGAPLHSKVK